MTRAALVFNSGRAAWRWRRRLLRALVDRGVSVTVLSPPDACVNRFATIGVRHVSLPMGRFVTPRADLRLMVALRAWFERERPDLVHTETLKPNVLATIAAHRAGVPRIVGHVNGLGSLFVPGGGPRRRLLRETAARGYRAGFRHARRVWVQNDHDAAELVRRRIAREAQLVLVEGSGVDVDEFDPARVPSGDRAALRAALGIPPDAVVVLMAAKLTASKGVRVLLDAHARVQEALRAQAHAPRVITVIAGDADPRRVPDPVPVSEVMIRARELGDVRVLGPRDDVPALLAMADVAALPSWYREGVPRFLLEALAMARPVITTDHPGCRATVASGENGYLVPVRDADALADATLALALDPAARRRMGRRSRERALARFDERDVTRRVLDEVYEL